jgi:hypothetical protein
MATQGYFRPDRGQPPGRPSQYFYWEDLPGRRLRPDLLTSRQGRLLELSAIGDGQQGPAPAGEYATALPKADYTPQHPNSPQRVKTKTGPRPLVLGSRTLSRTNLISQVAATSPDHGTF